MPSEVQRLPDFLIIGAGKSGTTSLDNYLKQHPALFMSEVKEPNYFAYEKIDFESLYEEAKQHYHDSVTDFDEYKSLFSDAGEDQLAGETSNTYLVVEGSAETIKSHLPDVKLIAILRQPTERLYSRFLHLARENELPSDNFEDVLDRDSIWWVRNDLVKEGFYYQNLSRFYNLFSAAQIKVIIYDDFRKDPQGVLDNIFQFLGVEPLKDLDFSVNYNKSGFVKNKFYDRTLGHNSVILRSVKKLMPRSLFEKAKNSIFLQKMVNKVRDQNLSQPKLDPELKSKITKEVYQDEIGKLEGLIGRDLSSWIR